MLKGERFGVDTAWKVSKYGIFSGPYFPSFGLNMEKYGPGKTPYLDTFRAVDFIWEGRLFQIFGPKTLKLLSPYFTWFGLVILRFKAFCFDFFESDNLKMSDYLLSCIFLNTDNVISLFSLWFSLLCLKLGGGCFRHHCTTVAKLSLIYSPFYSLIYMYKNARLMENS